MKLKREARRHIEAEVMTYRETMQAIADMRGDIIYGGKKGDELGMAACSGYESSITERRATKLADHNMLREMERITGAIARAYDNTTEECRDLLWLKYRLRIGWEPSDDMKAMAADKHRDLSVSEIALILHVDERTFHRYHSGFIYGIAERLGWW